MTATVTTREFNEQTCEYEYVEIPINVGDGVSYAVGSDAYPMTVRRISPSGKTIWCSSDQFRSKPRANSFAEADKVGVFLPQDTDPKTWTKFTKRSDGTFRESGRRHCRLIVGRSYKQDPHF